MPEFKITASRSDGGTGSGLHRIIWVITGPIHLLDVILIPVFIMKAFLRDNYYQTFSFFSFFINIPTETNRNLGCCVVQVKHQLTRTRLAGLTKVIVCRETVSFVQYGSNPAQKKNHFSLQYFTSTT